MEKAETKGAAFDFYGKLPLTKAVPLGLQHVLAMFVGNLTPILIITGACGIGAGSEFAELQVDLLQNAMLVAGDRDIGAALRHRSCGRKGPHYHGNQLRLHRCIQQCGKGHGRRHCRLRGHYAGLRSWRPV